MHFSIKASALKGLDDPVTVRFFVWVVCNSATQPKVLVIKGSPLTLKPGQMLFSRDEATRSLHQQGYTEREIEFAVEKCRAKGVLKSEVTEHGTVFSLNNSVVSLNGTQIQAVDGAEQQALEVIQYHQSIHPTARGHKKTGPTWKRLLSVIQDGYSVEDIKKAIDGNANDPWWKKKKLHALMLILREHNLPRFISAGTGKQRLADRWIEGLDAANNVMNAEPEWIDNEAGR